MAYRASAIRAGRLPGRMARRVRHDRASRRGTRRDSPDGPGCADGPRGSSYGQTDRTGGVDNGRAARGTTSRRAAARERLAGPLITAAGQLGVAVAQRQAAAAGVDDAKHKAQAHLRQAQLEADSMLTHAGDHVTAADDKYRQAHGDALTAGWSPAALTDMSYTPPAPPKRNRNQPAHPGTASTPLELVPAANDQTRVAQPLLRCTPRGQGLAAAARGPCKPASRQPSLARQQSCGATDHGSITSVDSADARPACGDVLGGARPSGWPGTEDELGVLRSAQLFRGLDPDDVAALLPAFAPRTLERGRQLFAQGDVDEADVFVELSGRFTVAREHRDGRAVTAVLGPGDMVGELSVFDPGPRTSTVTAVTGGRVAALTSSDLLAWGTSRPHVAARLLQVLARRLRRTNSTVADLMFVDVAGRMAKALLELAARFGERHGPEVWVPHGLTQSELGQLVGGSRETVNKTLSEFAGRGWLRLENRAVVLLDLPRLAQRARAAG